MQVPDRPILVLGASGYIGSNLVPRLLASGAQVRAAARDREALQAHGWTGAGLVAADVLEPESLLAAMQGVHTVYVLVHLMSYGRDLAELERTAASNVARAAAACGVRRIVYLGALLPGDPASEHIRARRETGEILRAGTVPVTEIRAGIIVGAGSAAFEVMRDLVLHLPAMVTPKWVRSKSPPIALDDLLEYLLALPGNDGDAHAVYDVGGPEVLTYEQMMRSLARLARRRAPLIVPVPLLSPRLSSYWLWLVTSVPTNVARARIDGLEHDFVADDAAARARVPRRLLTFDEAVEAAFEAERRHPGTAHFQEGNFGLRGGRLEHAYYAKRASGSAVGDVPAAAAWREIAAIGGPNGYYYLDVLWRVREAMDWAVGGPGRRSVERRVLEKVGDRVDTWEVIGLEAGRRLTMRFGMKAPGAGVLELAVQPLGDSRSRVTATAYWHPAGLWGLAYWWSLFPAHLVIFDGLSRAILRRAALAERGV
jgi:uncharacterized protein YbjT (DUF2867 family)